MQPLPSSHASATQAFAASEALAQRLTRTVRGDVRFDAGSRALYATDSSNYRQIPIGLVIPRDEADVVATIAACREFGAPVLPRGAGTSLAGQCCNVAVVLDFSRYLNGLRSLDPAARTARVQPGIVLDRVQEEAEVHHLTFAPDPATHSRCTLGGMIGNNSCGVHALMGGKTASPHEASHVLLWADTFTNYFQPHIAEAAYRVLADAGFTVRVLDRHVCCGRPLYDFGMLERAKQYLSASLDALSAEISSGNTHRGTRTELCERIQRRCAKSAGRSASGCCCPRFAPPRPIRSS